MKIRNTLIMTVGLMLSALSITASASVVNCDPLTGAPISSGSEVGQHPDYINSDMSES